MFRISVGGEEIGGGGRYDSLIPLLGGKNTPASGFAVYIDRLMEMVEPQAATGPVVVLKTAAGEDVPAGRIFGLAARLREAGYTATVDFGGDRYSRARWHVDIRAQSPFYRVADRVTGRRNEARDDDDVLATLKKVSG